MYIPIDIMIAETARSITMNGMNIMNPIRNAFWISDKTNAGITVVMGRLVGELTFSWL